MPDFPKRDVSNATNDTSSSVGVPSGVEKRRGARVNSRVPVSLEWDANGQTVRGDAHTRIVGPYGCLVVLPQSLEVSQQVRVVNLSNSEASPATVVWRGHHRSEGWELGIELINPKTDFWGLEL